MVPQGTIVLLFGLMLCPAFTLDRDSFYQYLSIRNEKLDSRCEAHLKAFLEGLEKGSTWTLRMLDAMGSIPKGIMKGNREDFGLYDECIEISEDIDEDTIKGKYCYAGLTIQLPNNTSTRRQHMQSFPNLLNIKSIPNDEGTSNVTFLHLGVCIPSGCLPSDLFDGNGVDTYCDTKNEYRQLDGGDISCLVFIVVVAALVIVSSLYDLYLHQREKETVHPIFIAFSAVTNGKKIVEASNSSEQIACFNGIKVISLFWVIVGHRFLTHQNKGIFNYDDTYTWMRKWYAVYILMAPMAVETFLYVTGAMMSYHFLKTMRKPGAKFNLPLYYLHRYIRLTPALAVLYFFQVTLMRKLSNGPQWQAIYEQTKETCLDAPWSFFLYIQNYVKHSDDLCLIHTWYVSVDMQFYIISPLILLPLKWWPKNMMRFGMPAITLVSVIIPIIIVYCYDIQMWTSDYYNLFYNVSHTRFTAWLIGITFGAFMLELQSDKEKYTIKSKLLIISVWIVVFAMIAAMVFGQDDVAFNHTALKSAFYLGLQRLIWGIFLSWVVYACLTGISGPINGFLSLPFFQTGSKTMYSTYLFHGSLLVHYIASQRHLDYFSDYETIFKATADIPIAVTFGTIWTLAFESPVIAIEKIIFGGSLAREIGGKIEDTKTNQIDTSDTAADGHRTTISVHNG